MDQYTQEPKEGWTKWTARQLVLANFVLVAYTKNYEQFLRTH